MILVSNAKMQPLYGLAVKILISYIWISCSPTYFMCEFYFPVEKEDCAHICCLFFKYTLVLILTCKPFLFK